MANKDTTTLTVKVPQALLRQLSRAATNGSRTRSDEVRARLEHSLRQMPVFTGAKA